MPPISRFNEDKLCLSSEKMRDKSVKWKFSCIPAFSSCANMVFIVILSLSTTVQKHARHISCIFPGAWQVRYLKSLCDAFFFRLFFFRPHWPLSNTGQIFWRGRRHVAKVANGTQTGDGCIKDWGRHTWGACAALRYVTPLMIGIRPTLC